MNKTFSCAIKGSSFQKSIEIDARKCKDVTSLQEAIAEDLGISISQFKILNPPENLTKMKKFCIDIQIIKPCDDVDFVFPDQKNILIKNYNEKEFEDIISIFRDNGIFLSSRCIIKDIRFNLFGEDVLLENDIFSFIPKGAQVKVELSGNVIILKYHDIQFILSENEPIKNSISLIQEKLTGCSEISIKSLLHEEFDPETKLKKKDNNNYVIEANQQFIFTLLDENSAKSLKLDYFATVEEARQLLSSMHSFGIELKPKDVIIYDSKNRKVKNFDEKLINIKDDENKVYFDIPVLTEFAEKSEEAAPKKSKKGAGSKKPKTKDEEETNSSPKKPKTKSDEAISIYFFFESDKDLNGDIKITVSMTIEEVKQKIAGLYNIENEIHLKYKQGNEFIELDDDMKIEDVKDDIKRGKNKYKIYVESKKDEKEEEEDKKDFLNEKIDPELIKKEFRSKPKKTDKNEADKKVEIKEDKEEEDENSVDFLNEKVDMNAMKKQFALEKKKIENEAKPKVEIKGNKEEENGAGVPNGKVNKAVKDESVSKRRKIAKPKIVKKEVENDDDNENQKGIRKAKPKVEKKGGDENSESTEVDKEDDEKSKIRKDQKKKADDSRSSDDDNADGDAKKKKKNIKPTKRPSEEDSSRSSDDDNANGDAKKKKKNIKPTKRPSEEDDSLQDEKPKEAKKSAKGKKDKELSFECKEPPEAKKFAKGKRGKESSSEDEEPEETKKSTKDKRGKESSSEDEEPKEAKKSMKAKKGKKSSSEDEDENKQEAYRFIFGSKSKKLPMNSNSFLADNKDQIKEAFNIDEENDLDFYIKGFEDEDDETIDAENEKLGKLKNDTIKVEIHQETAEDFLSVTLRTTITKGEEKVDMCTYFYKTNLEDEEDKEQKIELESTAKVVDLKNKIKELKGVESLSSIKVLFAGKDLLNDIVLESLKIGNSQLYIYIRPEQDFLCVTANALLMSTLNRGGKLLNLDEEEEEECEDD